MRWVVGAIKHRWLEARNLKVQQQARALAVVAEMKRQSKGESFWLTSGDVYYTNESGWKCGSCAWKPNNYEGAIIYATSHGLEQETLALLPFVSVSRISQYLAGKPPLLQHGLLDYLNISPTRRELMNNIHPDAEILDRWGMLVNLAQAQDIIAENRKAKLSLPQTTARVERDKMQHKLPTSQPTPAVKLKRL